MWVQDEIVEVLDRVSGGYCRDPLEGFRSLFTCPRQSSRDLSEGSNSLESRAGVPEMFPIWSP